MNDDIKPGQNSETPVNMTPKVAPAAAKEPVVAHVVKSDSEPSTTVVVAKPPKSRYGRSGWHDFFSTIGILFTAMVVAFLMIAFVFRSYQVDGPSMQNTLQNNDKLIIWKIPRTWAKLTHHNYIPERGNIIVFTQSNLSACGQDGSKQLIKRVIGLPGDRVVVANGVFTIYNKQHPNGFDPDKTLSYFKNTTIPVTTGSETNGTNIDITLTATQLFVSGDNRPDSCDSRAFGPIQASQVVGKLALRVFPVNAAKVF